MCEVSLKAQWRDREQEHIHVLLQKGHLEGIGSLFVTLMEQLVFSQGKKHKL